MSNIQTIIDALLKTRGLLTEKKKTIAELKKTENSLVKDIKTYLNERGETGLRLDEKTTISLSIRDKRIYRSKTDHRSHIEQLLYNTGIQDPDLVTQLLDRTVDTVQEQRLSFNKDK